MKKLARNMLIDTLFVITNIIVFVWALETCQSLYLSAQTDNLLYVLSWYGTGFIALIAMLSFWISARKTLRVLVHIPLLIKKMVEATYEE